MIFYQDTFYLELKDFQESDRLNVYTACKQYRQGKQKTWENIPDPSDKRRCLIKLSSIPESTLLKYGIDTNAITLLQISNSLKALVVTDPKHIDFYQCNPSSYNLATEYARIAAWLQFCATIKPSKCRELGFKSLENMYEVVLENMKKEHFKTWKVDNLQVFKRRLKPFNQAFKKKIDITKALSSVICKRFSTANAVKLSDEQKNLLIQLYSSPNKPNFTQTYNLYVQRASEKIHEYINSNGERGWSPKAIVSQRCIENFLNKPEVRQTWYMARHGANEWRQLYDPTIKRNAPSFANALWVMDGSPWHRYYVDGKNAYARLNIFPIIDAYSWCVIGFAVDFNENADMVKRALFGAVNRSGVLPYQLQYDHSSANMSVYTQMCVDKLSKYNTPTQVGNARSKIIEPFFKHFNDQVLKFVPGYAGSNITAKKIDSKANREYLQQLIKSDQLPTLQDALAQMEAAFHIWNNKPFNGPKSPLQKYQESFEATKDRQRFVTEMNMIDAFWEMPGKIQQIKGIDENGKTKMVSRFIPREYTFTSAGITIERDGKEYQFDVENAEFRAYNIGKKFNVKYDHSKMDRLFLIENDKPVTDKDGNIIIAKEKTVLHMAVVDRVEGEGKEAHRLNKLREEQKQLLQNNHKKVVEQTQLDGTFTPVTLGNLYPKETENAIKASRMESLLGDTSLTEKKKKSKDMPQIFDALEPVAIPQQLDQSGEATPKIDRWS
jgi:hypothetical protein